MRKKSFITVTDQFCGAGGSSEGAEEAGAEVHLAMNHWQRAGETYSANHPKTDIIITDVQATDPRLYKSTDILITSPECTNHSLAKGKKRSLYEKDIFGTQLIDPSEERSRATMWDVPRFAEVHDYRVIVTENVVDAGKWRLWDSWLHAMHSLDYQHEVVYFNSMFAHPTPQSRDRMYVVFWKRNHPKPDLEFRPKAYCPRCGKDVKAIQFWKKNLKWGRYEDQYFYVCPKHLPQNIGRNQTKAEWQMQWSITPYYYAAFNAIDFTIPSVRIGDRERPLMESTRQRIQYGLEQWGKQVMIVSTRYQTGNRVHNANVTPCPTQVGDASHAVVMPWIIDTAHTKGSGKYSWDSDKPMPTQTSAQTLAIISHGFISKQYTGQGHYLPLTSPMETMTASSSHHALLSTGAFLSYYYGTNQASQMNEPVRTMVGNERTAILQGVESGITIDDLYFRMMTPKEVGTTMAFPKEYKVFGTAKEIVKQYGNAVTPPVMKQIMKRCMATFR